MQKKKARALGRARRAWPPAAIRPVVKSSATSANEHLERMTKYSYSTFSHHSRHCFSSNFARYAPGAGGIFTVTVPSSHTSGVNWQP